MEKSEFARRLRIKNRWLVDDSTGIVRTAFTYGGKAISLEFVRDEDEKFRISFPRYNYSSKTSHYTSFEPEARQCVNKDLLFHVVGHLKMVGVWPEVSNQGFFRVNVENKKASYKEVSRNMRIRLEKKSRLYKEAKALDATAETEAPQKPQFSLFAPKRGKNAPQKAVAAGKKPAPRRKDNDGYFG